MDNPPYSSDLTPSYFHLTGPLKKHPTGNWYATDADVKQAVTSWIQTSDTNLFHAGIQVLVPQCGQVLKCYQWLCGHLLHSHHLLHICHIHI
jgi:hypothetical protein